MSSECGQAFLDTLLSSITELVILLDRSGRIVRFNRACETLSGYSEEEAIGKTIWSLLFSAHQQSTIQGRFESLRRDQFPFQYQNHLFTREGEKYSIKWTNTALIDRKGEIDGIVCTGNNITELRRSKKRAEMFERIVSASSGHLSFVDSNYIYRAVNNAYLEAHNLSYEEIVDTHVADLLGQEIFEDIKPRIDRCLAGETISYQGWFDFKGPGRRLMDVSYSPAKDHNDKIIGMVVNARDISDQNEAESERRLAAKVFQNAGDAILITDSKGNILEVNPAFCAISGYERSEVLGKNPNFGKSGRHDHAFYEAMWKGLLNFGRWEGEVWDRRKNGEVYPKWLKITAVADATGQVNHYVGIFSDISEQKAQVDRLQRLAHHDPLTELPNRALFYDRLSQAIVQARRDERRIAVMFIDLDYFKVINDEHGHDVGDRLLCGVADRLSGCVRESDTVARLGGDEFTAILTDIANPEAATAVAEKMSASLKKPISIGRNRLHVSCSIGISIFPDCCTTADELIKCADNALYRSKHLGRDRHTLFLNKE